MSTDGTTEPGEPVTVTTDGVTVRSYTQAGWHLVTAGGWEVSVAPDGLIMLPRHLHPNEVADFIASASAAVPVGLEQMAANEKRTTPPPTDEELAEVGKVIVAETGVEPPEGSVRMVATPRINDPRDRAAIGRPRRRDPREPVTHQPPLPPIPSGGRHGRTQQ